MNLIYAAFAFLLALVLALVGVTRVGSWLIERRNPPVGAFADINGARIHYVHFPAPANADLPPIVFIHGASANLKDQMLPLEPVLEGRAEMLFFDRPGFGWSGRGPANNENPSAQAATIAALMDHLGIKKAIIVGHSFGGVVTSAFGREHADKTLGLVFLAPATHPWPGGATSWYYDLTTVPVIGRLFSETLTYPAGTLQMADATTCVFSPNKVPDNYLAAASIPLVLRPSAFRANARDVAGLYRYALDAAPHYNEIKAPTVVVSGDRDKVVYARIHSVGLARDIAGAELIWVHNLGHKPDWIAPDLVVGAIEKVAGMDVDLEALARTVETRIASDAYGAGKCADIKEPQAELAPT
ncbi:alpha/beta hydrolase [Mesorhizobium sp. B2-3-4]|uniref:alpha/beta fold hydrolase n=1 Tax=Mesorhizobium sp. B2-3-4 TaxID=2589959 RepID=UPI00112BCF13|nr:alpha/beta hydrolase [Mesorhizobium sp. B2-3-4]TPM29303.1 alpha/beta hydrolase [Mesorhizobium sp. B2-3-4]